MSHEITITLYRSELRALLAHTSTDPARINLHSVWLVPDGRAFATDGPRLAMTAPKGTSPAAGSDVRDCVPVGRDAVSAALKGARKGDAFTITASL